MPRPPIAGQQLSLFDVAGGEEEQRNKPYKAVVTKVYDVTGDGGVDMFDVAELFKSHENELTELQGDGDFRSKECLALLDEADIVVTNPPFSLFREYVAVLMKHKKKFIVIGSQNAITYKEFFPLLKDDKVWLGSMHPKEFIQHNGTVKKFGNICWFTNLDIKKRHEELILVKKYAGHEDEYPTYDNYDAIEVSKVADIPLDYAGVMGVPVTFLDKYSPDQFEILGLSIGTLFDGNPLGKEFMDAYRAQGGTGHYSENMIGLALIDLTGKAKVPYGRVLIRNKHPEQPKEVQQ